MAIKDGPSKAELSGSQLSSVWGVDRRWIIVAVIGIGSFTSAFDTSMLNTVLPIIRTDFSVDLASVEWIIMIYLLVTSSLLPILGRLGDMIGHKVVYMGGFLIFTIGSGLCGTAQDLPSLLAFRGLQAIGGAALFASAPAIVTGNFPVRQLGQALGAQATTIYLGLVAGPPLGGYLADLFGWRSVFLIKVPIGFLALLLVWFLVPKDKIKALGQRFDILGAGLFMAGLTSLLLGLSKGESWGWLTALTLALLTSGLLLLLAFVLFERKTAQPMLDLGLFRNRLFTAATSSAFLNYVCVFSLFLLLPFYLIQARGFSPSEAGLLMSAQFITMAIIAPMSGWLSDRIGSRIPASLGMALIGISMLLIGQLGADADKTAIWSTLVLTGLGVGLFTSPNNSAIMQSVGPTRRGVAAGVSALARNVGMVTGVAISGAIFATRLSQLQGSISESSPAFFTSMHDALWIMAIAAFLGVLASSVRGGAKVSD